jgi:hypothetical protein
VPASYTLTVSIKTQDSWASPAELRLRYELEEQLAEALQASGNGAVDRGDSGLGVRTSFGYNVLAPEATRAAAKIVLAKRGVEGSS